MKSYYVLPLDMFPASLKLLGGPGLMAWITGIEPGCDFSPGLGLHPREVRVGGLGGENALPLLDKGQQLGFLLPHKRKCL